MKVIAYIHSLVGSNILLWTIFISMVNYPYELMTIGSNSKTKKDGYKRQIRWCTYLPHLPTSR